MLLGVEEPRLTSWPFPQRVLIVDGEELYRRFGVATLEAAGAGCYGAKSVDRALRLFKADEGVGIVLLDADSLDGNSHSFVQQVRSVRPQVTMIGISSQDCYARFAQMGINLVLSKPWRLNDLIELLSRQN